MAKRFRMISPFDVVTGNVSGSQDLKYPTKDNKAYEAPAGKHYATNYKPRFIMHERKSDGLAYFSLRQRTAINKTAKSTLAMAVTGACGAIVGAILADKSSELYIKLMQLYEAGMRSVNGKQSFRAMLSDTIMKGLRAKQSLFFFVGPAGGQIVDASFNNPYVSGGTAAYNVTISTEVLVKFWPVLANNPISFVVEGVGKGVAHMDDTFNTLIPAPYNNLGLTSIESGQVKLSGDYGEYLLDGENYVDESDAIYADTVFTLTNIAPNA